MQPFFARFLEDQSMSVESDDPPSDAPPPPPLPPFPFTYKFPSDWEDR
uniref:Esterase n=1 Tax=Tolypothrix bouteillei VB521301 TaxID=1479485 RepID=A0A0C1R292_9CYAN